MGRVRDITPWPRGSLVSGGTSHVFGETTSVRPYSLPLGDRQYAERAQRITDLQRCGRPRGTLLLDGSRNAKDG